MIHAQTLVHDSCNHADLIATRKTGRAMKMYRLLQEKGQLSDHQVPSLSHPNKLK